MRKHERAGFRGMGMWTMSTPSDASTWCPSCGDDCIVDDLRECPQCGREDVCHACEDCPSCRDKPQCEECGSYEDEGDLDCGLCGDCYGEREDTHDYCLKCCEWIPKEEGGTDDDGVCVYCRAEEKEAELEETS